MKKILILDDERNFIMPVLEKIENKLGSEAYLYFQYPGEFFSAIEQGQLEETACIILDMLFIISEAAERDNDTLTGIAIAKEVRRLGYSGPIAFYTVSNSLKLMEECKIIEGTVFINKADKLGFKKLFQFIEKHSAQ